MPNESEITPQEIVDWLKQNGHSRDWLAEQTGASATTVSGWLATGKPRPIPAPTLRLIERLMCDDLLGEPQYSFADAKVIRKAMVQEGYTSLRDFVRDAVVANARRIMGAKDKIVEMRAEAENPPQAGDRFWAKLLGGIAAGAPIEAVEEEEIPVGKAYPDDHYALRVFGKSMEPKIPDESVIIVKRWKDMGFPKKGTIVVYSDRNGSSLKEFGYRPAEEGDENASLGKVPVLRSINPAFPNVQTMEGGRIDAVLVEVL